MNSGGLGYESTLPAHATVPPAYGEALPEIEDSPVASENFDGGKYWPLAFAIFAPVAAAYAAIAYGVYVVAHAVF